MSNDKTPIAGLEAKNVSKAFGANLALQDVSLVMSPGEVLCLVGENGAGKSTLGKIFAGYQSMTRGRIYLDGEQLEGLTPRRTRSWDRNGQPGSRRGDVGFRCGERFPW